MLLHDFLAGEARSDVKRSQLVRALALGLTVAAAVTLVAMLWSVSARAWWTPLPLSVAVAIAVRVAARNASHWAFRTIALVLSYLLSCALHLPAALEHASVEAGNWLAIPLATAIAIAHPVADLTDGLWGHALGTVLGCLLAWRLAAPYPRRWGPPALRRVPPDEAPPPSSRGEYSEIVAAALIAAKSETHHSRPTPPEGWDVTDPPRPVAPKS
jgi:hypothetical protein